MIQLSINSSLANKRAKGIAVPYYVPFSLLVTRRASALILWSWSSTILELEWDMEGLVIWRGRNHSNAPSPHAGGPDHWWSSCIPMHDCTCNWYDICRGWELLKMIYEFASVGLWYTVCLPQNGTGHPEKCWNNQMLRCPQWFLVIIYPSEEPWTPPTNHQNHLSKT